METILISEITNDNWTFCHYNHGEQKAMITFGASTEHDEIYYVSLLGDDDKALFQTNHLELTDAIKTINQKYRIWSFNNELEKSGGGCDTCAAK